MDAVRQQSHLPIDVHLMIEQPENYINLFAEHGADMISVHVESTTHIHRAIEQIKQLGKSRCRHQSWNICRNNFTYIEYC